jgi:hypothetical protein
MTCVKRIKWCCIGHILIPLYNSYKQILGNGLMPASWVYMKRNCNRSGTHARTHTHKQTHTHTHTHTHPYVVLSNCLSALHRPAEHSSTECFANLTNFIKRSFETLTVTHLFNKFPIYYVVLKRKVLNSFLNMARLLSQKSISPTHIPYLLKFS